MDIHDKSSNWGPMAGFVPCDPAFCKVPTGAPQRGLRPHSHGLAHPVHLELPSRVISQLIGLKITNAVFGATVMPTTRGDRSIDGVPARFDLYGAHPTVQGDRGFTLYRPMAAPAGLYKDLWFAIDERRTVWWVDMRPADSFRRERSVTLRPVWVWAYDVAGGRKPVTGDYDIWALVPHISRLNSLDDHALVSLDQTSHGASAASAHFKRISAELNEACGRSANTVFNHGAEAQNFGFAQKHDKEILMFPPVSDPTRVRKIPMDRMTHVLAEIEHAGYLVLLNRVWTTKRPKLLGMDLPGVIKLFKSIHLGKLKATHEKFAKNTKDSALRRTMWKEASGAAVAEVRFEASQRYEGERQAMAEWYRQLKELLPAQGGARTVLEASDFPRQYQTANAAMHALQLKFEGMATAHMTGGGQNDTEGMKRDLEQERQAFAELIKYWSGPQAGA